MDSRCGRTGRTRIPRGGNPSGQAGRTRGSSPNIRLVPNTDSPAARKASPVYRDVEMSSSDSPTPSRNRSASRPGPEHHAAGTMCPIFLRSNTVVPTFHGRTHSNAGPTGPERRIAPCRSSHTSHRSANGKYGKRSDRRSPLRRPGDSAPRETIRAARQRPPERFISRAISRFFRASA